MTKLKNAKNSGEEHFFVISSSDDEDEDEVSHEQQFSSDCTFLIKEKYIY